VCYYLRMKFFSRIFLFATLFFVLSFLPTPTFAAQTSCTWTKTTSGGWTEPANWSCGVVPNGAQYDVTICNASAAAAITVTATTSITVGRLTVGSPGGANSSCNTRVHTLDVNGVGLTIENSDGWTSGAGDLQLGANGVIQAGTGTWTVKGNANINQGSSTATNRPFLTAETSTFVFTTGTQSVNQTGVQQTGGGFYNLTIAPTAATTTLGGTITVTNVLTGSGGGIAASSTAPTLTLTGVGTPFVKGGSYFTGIPAVYTGCSANKNIAGGGYASLTIGVTVGTCSIATTTLLGNVSIGGGLTFYGDTGQAADVQTLDTGGYDLSVTGTTTLGTPIVTVYLPARIYVTGNSTLSLGSLAPFYTSPCSACGTSLDAGIWITNGNTVNISGNVYLSTNAYEGVAGASGAGMIFNAGTSTVNFTGTTTQILGFVDYSNATPQSFYNVVVNNTGSNGNNSALFGDQGGYTIPDIHIQNTLTLTDGVLDFAQGNAGNVSVGGNLTVNGSGASINSNADANRLIFDGTTTYTDSTNAFDLGDIYVASSTAAATFTLGSNATSTYLHLGTGETLDLGSYTLNLSNTSATTTPLVLLGTFTPNTGTVKYKGTSSTIAPALYYNLNTENAGKLYTIAASSTVTNNLTNTAGTLLLSGATTTVIGTITNADTIRESTGVLSKAATSLALDNTAYTTGDTMTLTLIDQDGNLVGTSTQSLAGTTVTVSSGADSETITLTETGNATYTFTGTLPIANATVSANDGTLQVSSAGTITVAYIDPQDYTDTSATDTATVTVASSGGGGGGSSGSSSSGGGVVLFAPYNPGATVGSQTQTPPAVEPPPPAQNTNTSSSGGISSALRAEITPVIAILLTGPIYTNLWD
jgi:hypothetical protein